MKSIGQAALQFNLPSHVLRFWESEGLLSPTREGNRRRYSDDDLRRVAAIRYARQAGLGLADIRAILAADTAADRQKVIAGHMAELTARIAHAQAALDMLRGGLDCPHDDVLTCPSFRKLAGTPEAAASGGEHRATTASVGIR